MQTRTACPNCGHETYLAMTVQADGSGLRLSPYRPGLGNNPENLLSEKLDKIFSTAPDAEYELIVPAVQIVDNGVPTMIPGAVTRITLKRAKVRAVAGDMPTNCPDCNTAITKGRGCCSIKPLGFLNLLIFNEHRDDTLVMNKLFPPNIPYTLSIRRAGNSIDIRSRYEDAPDFPEPPAAANTLAEIRERAVMDGIEGAEDMNAAEITQARKKLKPAKV